MKVAHITPSFYPAHVYGGATQSSYLLCRYLAGKGCDVRVLTTDANSLDRVLKVDIAGEALLADGLRVRYCRRVMRHSVSPTLLRLLPEYVRWADVVHLTAVYSFPTIPTLLLCRMLGKPVVWSPRGALQRWEGTTRPRLKAVWEAICRAVAPARVVLHVTSEQEASECRERMPCAETVIIPNGVEIPDKPAGVQVGGILRLLYLGRLHPKKGIESLLAACAELNREGGIGWGLTVAGAGDPVYFDDLCAQTSNRRLTQQVRMVGEVQGGDKEKVFEQADVVVVPSYTENFAMVVAEALAHAVPVIVSQGAPWQRVEEIGCGLWVSNDPESLAKAIEQMSQMPLHEMGQRGREWMKKEFAWPLRAQEMIHLYDRMVK